MWPGIIFVLIMGVLAAFPLVHASTCDAKVVRVNVTHVDGTTEEGYAESRMQVLPGDRVVAHLAIDPSCAGTKLDVTASHATANAYTSLDAEGAPIVVIDSVAACDAPLQVDVGLAYILTLGHVNAGGVSCEAPPCPDVRAEAQADGSVRLAWNSTDATSYEVRRAVAAGPLTFQARVDAGTYDDVLTAEGTHYRYQVAASTGGPYSERCPSVTAFTATVDEGGTSWLAIGGGAAVALVVGAWGVSRWS